MDSSFMEKARLAASRVLGDIETLVEQEAHLALMPQRKETVH